MARSIQIVVVAAVLAFGAAPALAAQRYAAPSPAGSGNCSSPTNPCDIATAIGGANTNDEVIVAPGTYGPLSTEIHVLHDNVSIHGVVGQPRPRVLFNVAPNGLRMQGLGDIARYLDVENSGGDAIVSTDGGTIDQVFARSSASGSTACGVSPGTVTNSVCWSTTTSGRGAEMGAAGTATSTVRNVTAYAPATNGTGVLVDANSSAHLTLNATNVIARGGFEGFHASAVNSSSATLNFDHSNFEGVGGNSDGTSTDSENAGPGNQTAPPQLINPGIGDFRELAGSPTVDAGINSPANGAFDADGNLRTLGARTDIGAYELAAAPAVAYLTPGSVTPTAETVNPNGGVTSAHFEYGSTPALGSSTPAQSLGPATTPQSISATLTGLAPGTAYYYRLVAANDGGTTTGATQRFATAPPILSVLGKLGLIAGVTFNADCAVGPCSGTAVLTVTERVRSGHVLSLARRRTRRRTVVVGRVNFALVSGATTRVSVPLNRTGRRLLARFHRLPATLTVTLSTPVAQFVVKHRKVTIKPHRRHHRHH